MAGWLKLYRDIIDKPIWKNSTPEQKTILITLLCMVNHDEETWEWKGKKYVCKAGQKITSLPKIAQEAGKGISLQNVRTALERFKKLEFLTDESTNESRLITIINWDLYQTGDTKVTDELTGDQQMGNRRVTSNKNNKNNKNKEIINNKSLFQNLVDLYTSNKELSDTIVEFMNHRKNIKKPIKTEYALKLILNKLDKFTQDDSVKIEILNQSIANGWQGIFELKKDVKPNVTNISKFRPANMTNFDQRKYDDDFFESLYENT